MLSVVGVKDMGENQRPLLTRRAFPPLILAAFLLVLAQPMALAKDEARPPLASAEAVLARIKEAHPDAQILKIELLRNEEEEGPAWIYEAKLFPPDGRILKLAYDAQTLALLETTGGEHNGEGQHHQHGHRPCRLRLRRGW